MGGFLRRHKTSGLMPLGEPLGGDGVMGRYLAEVPVQIVGTMAGPAWTGCGPLARAWTCVTLYATARAGRDRSGWPTWLRDLADRLRTQITRPQPAIGWTYVR